VKYDLDPSKVSLPLREEDLDVISSDIKILKDTSIARHFLARVSSTVTVSEKKLAKLAADMQRITSSRTAVGRPTSLSPLDAAQYLSTEQKSELFTRTQQQMIDATRQTQQDAENYKARILAFLEAVETFRNEMASDPSVDPESKKRVQELIHQLTS
jgi:hypothetical protein